MTTKEKLELARTCLRRHACRSVRSAGRGFGRQVGKEAPESQRNEKRRSLFEAPDKVD
jgi:hypothetical protein